LDKNCTCAEFCNHTCAATNAGTVHIQQMYRLSPGNVTALADKDTGDAAGDMGFFFLKLNAFYKCKEEDANTVDCFLAYKPIVRKFTVVLDGKWGPFMRCNPLPFPGYQDRVHVDTLHWGCFPWHGYAPKPWVPVNHSTSCPDQVYCPDLMNKTVGRDPAMHHAFDPAHPTISNYFGGAWYSTPGQAMCGTGRSPGDGKTPYCSWKLAQDVAPKSIDAFCMLDKVMPLIESNGSPCFEKCGAKPYNRNSSCYLDCVPDSIIGKSSLNIPPISRAPVIAAWEGAFDDEKEGGCPPISA